MSKFERILNINLPKKQSAFLWGARKTGKSTYLKTNFPNAIYYDLLKTDLYLRLIQSPNILREELLAREDDNSLVIVDEVQKVPQLMDEIQWLIDNTNFKFILCGSSARKLKRQAANMLGGRAWRYNFFPLVFPEIPNFDLLKIFNNGTLPSHYSISNAKKSLHAYLVDYISLEIQSEGLVRNLPAFTRFLDALRFSHGELINYSNIARQASIDAKTVKEYFHILEDTLLGYFLLPYRKKVSRQIISETPKFYLFDVGVANSLMKKQINELSGIDAGKSLEQYIFLELTAYKSLTELDKEITYWRTKDGLEVDFIIGDADMALEVKISSNLSNSELKGMKAFIDEHKPKKAIVVTLEKIKRAIPYKDSKIILMPIQEFLEKLWAGKIF